MLDAFHSIISHCLDLSQSNKLCSRIVFLSNLLVRTRECKECLLRFAFCVMERDLQKELSIRRSQCSFCYSLIEMDRNENIPCNTKLARNYKITNHCLTNIQLDPHTIPCTLPIVLFYETGNRLVRNRRQSKCMSTFARGIYKSLREVGDSLIPNKNRTRLVTNTAREVLPTNDMVKKLSS